jgi:hypothetical protein
VRGRGLLLVVALLSLASCATVRDNVQRTTEGPTAEEIFAARFQDGFKRQPTFDETTSFRNEMDERISRYLSRNPDVAASPRASGIRFARRVSVGMSKAEVLLLVGQPTATTQDPVAMRQAAGSFWPAIQPRAVEMWSYPATWQLYFDGSRLVDLTFVGRAPE